MRSKGTNLRERWTPERTAARSARQGTDADDERRHLERAHLLSQPMAGVAFNFQFRHPAKTLDLIGLSLFSREPDPDPPRHAARDRARPNCPDSTRRRNRARERPRQSDNPTIAPRDRISLELRRPPPTLLSHNRTPSQAYQPVSGVRFAGRCPNPSSAT
jgi:hypothetical protein